MSAKKLPKINCEQECTSLKINNLTVNIKNNFYPDKRLYDILFSIVNLRLKEKSA